VNMLFIYPQWPVDSHALVSFLPWFVLVSFVFWCWSQRATWGRHALLGIGFFLINLAPFVGFQSVSYMQFTWVMDHFLYIPVIGLIGLAVAALEMIENRISAPLRLVLAGMIAAVLTLLACESSEYAETFIGPETLWTYTLRHNPGSFLARNNLGNVLLETGRAPEAIIEYRKALQLNPEMVEARTNLGFALDQTGHVNEAIENYELALKVDPHFSLAHAHLADALNQEGDTQEAIDHYEQVLLANPDDRHAREEIARLRPSLEKP
jgi:tetratricopeptide (TPR) repeat protein